MAKVTISENVCKGCGLSLHNGMPEKNRRFST